MLRSTKFMPPGEVLKTRTGCRYGPMYSTVRLPVRNMQSLPKGWLLSQLLLLSIHLYPKLVVERGYAVKKGKSFRSTALGEELIELLEKVDKKLCTPDTRRMVEQMMREVEEGKKRREEALEEALGEYRSLFRKLRSYLS